MKSKAHKRVFFSEGDYMYILETIIAIIVGIAAIIGSIRIGTGWKKAYDSFKDILNDVLKRKQR